MTVEYDLIQPYGTPLSTDRHQALINVYTEIFTEPPYRDAPDTAADFAKRLPGELSQPGSSLVIAHQARQVIGFTYGFPLPSNTRWWTNVQPPLTDEDSTETGHRTFAIIEMHVLTPWRRRGIATTLHHHLLTDRPEQRATLAVRETATAAQAVYRAWGYRSIGHEEVTASGRFLVMLRDLPEPKELL